MRRAEKPWVPLAVEYNTVWIAGCTECCLDFTVESQARNKLTLVYQNHCGAAVTPKASPVQRSSMVSVFRSLGRSIHLWILGPTSLPSRIFVWHCLPASRSVPC